MSDQSPEPTPPLPPWVLEPSPIQPDYPVPFPKATGFGPLDSDNVKEWHSDRRRWEAEQKSEG